jgi:hypothetical protein
MLYAVTMKRLQILIEEELDEALAREARRSRTSKAALIRRYVREQLGGLPPFSADPLGQMIGVDDFDPENIDEVVYG